MVSAFHHLGTSTIAIRRAPIDCLREKDRVSLDDAKGSARACDRQRADARVIAAFA
jgi:hypothetical protein